MKNENELIADADRQVGAIGNEASRYAFTYDHFSLKGKWLHYFMKKFVISAVFYIHSQIIKKYSEQAFVFQDPRLRFIQQFTGDYFKENMEERKAKILNASMDICLFILKEDIFYRVRIIDMIMKFLELYCAGKIQWKGEPLFGLDGPEKENLALWKGK